MPKDKTWPLFFELNLIQRKARRERTVFVNVHRDGKSQWTDHTGRMTRLGGAGGINFGPEGEVRHIRGDKELSEEAERAERAEFTVSVELEPGDFGAIRSLVERVGEPWTDGWEQGDAEALHGMLENLYWKHVNRHMNDPFDPTDG